MDIDKQLNKMLGKKKMSNVMPKISSSSMFPSIFPQTSKAIKKSNIVQGLKKDFKTGMKPLFDMADTNKVLGGASKQKQQQWKQMTPKKKAVARKRYKDSDGDRVPDRWDCQPKNVWRQDIVGDNSITIPNFLYSNKPVVEFITDEGQLDLNLKKYPELQNYEYIDYQYNYETDDGGVDVSNVRIYYKQGQKNRALKIIGIIQSLPVRDNLNDPRTLKQYHVMMGKLYGYNDSDIQDFVSKGDFV